MCLAPTERDLKNQANRLLRKDSILCSRDQKKETFDMHTLHELLGMVPRIVQVTPEDAPTQTELCYEVAL